MIKDSQYKKLEKVMERAQKENATEKIEKLAALKKLVDGTPEYERLSHEIAQIRTISDGTKQTYYDVLKAVLREAERKFGLTQWKHFKKEQAEQIIQDKIAAGESAQNIRKVVHALDFFQEHATKTRVFKENQVEIADHQKNLQTLKEQKVIRKSADSHRYKATKEESLRVIEEMEKYNPHFASIARYQLLTGFRVSEAIRQKTEHVDLLNDKHHAKGAKGGLDNVVHTDHHTEDDKAFLKRLLAKTESDTGRLFARQKDDKGNYKSDAQIRHSVTRLARRCADRLGIGGDGLTFSSHCFRGAFAIDRMLHYVEKHKEIDRIIEEKIAEQPRLRSKYENFEKRIKNKTKNPEKRQIQIYEKIQWLVSTDINHSRQDITRYYVSVKEIKAELKKHQ